MQVLLNLKNEFSVVRWLVRWVVTISRNRPESLVEYRDTIFTVVTSLYVCGVSSSATMQSQVFWMWLTFCIGAVCSSACVVHLANAEASHDVTLGIVSEGVTVSERAMLNHVDGRNQGHGVPRRSVDERTLPDTSPRHEHWSQLAVFVGVAEHFEQVHVAKVAVWDRQNGLEQTLQLQWNKETCFERWQRVFANTSGTSSWTLYIVHVMLIIFFCFATSYQYLDNCTTFSLCDSHYHQDAHVSRGIVQTVSQILAVNQLLSCLTARSRLCKWTRQAQKGNPSPCIDTPDIKQQAATDVSSAERSDDWRKDTPPFDDICRSSRHWDSIVRNGEANTRSGPWERDDCRSQWTETSRDHWRSWGSRLGWLSSLVTGLAWSDLWRAGRWWRWR